MAQHSVTSGFHRLLCFYELLRFFRKRGMDPVYMEILEEGFTEFFESTVPSNPLNSEYLLPTHISGLLHRKKATVRLLETNDRWFGITYKEDKDAVIESIHRLIQSGSYAKDLYSDL